MSVLATPEERFEENLQRLKAERNASQKIVESLCVQGGAVWNLLNAKRGNNADEYNAERIDRVHAYTLDENTRRFKESVARFSSTKEN